MVLTFAGPAVLGALCRELPLGTGCAERIALSAQAQIPVVVEAEEAGRVVPAEAA
jgi:hypothetical protein